MSLPRKVSDQVLCAAGGKHVPRGAEAKVQGSAIKYEKCEKCGLQVGERK